MILKAFPFHCCVDQMKRTRSRRSPYRAKSVREKRGVGGYKGWRDKRIFGERVRATSIWEIFREAKMKFICYNILLNCV